MAFRPSHFFLFLVFLAIIRIIINLGNLLESATVYPSGLSEYISNQLFGKADY